MKVLLAVALAFLVGCASTEPDPLSDQAETKSDAITNTRTKSNTRSEPITGTRIRGQSKAYLAMCERNPDSILCPEKENEQ